MENISVPERISATSPTRGWLSVLLIFGAVLIYLYGCFPFAAAEGDDQGIVNGVVALSRHLPDAHQIAYNYAVQPGTYGLISAFFALTKVSPIVIFGVLSSLGASCFVLVASQIGSTLTATSRTTAVLLLLGCQEMFTAGWYANSSAIAAPIIAGAILISLRKHSVAGETSIIILVAVAGWIRMDSLLLAPAIFPALIYQGSPIKRAAFETLRIALLSLLLLGVLLVVSHTSLQQTWAAFRGRPPVGQWSALATKGWMALSLSVLCFTSVGWLAVVYRKCGKLLLICAVGALPSLLVYGANLTTTKYLYYSIPFLIYPLLAVFSPIFPLSINLKKLLGTMLLVSVLAEMAIGVRSTASDFRRFQPEPWIAKLGEWPIGGHRLEIGIGEGEIIGTDDAFRVRSGWAFAPRVWHREKQAAVEAYACLRAAIDPSGRGALTTTYLSYQATIGALLDGGAYPIEQYASELDEHSLVSTWKIGESRYTVVLINNSPAERSLFAHYLQEFPAALFVNDRGEKIARYFGVNRGEWKCLCADEAGLVTIYHHESR